MKIIIISIYLTFLISDSYSQKPPVLIKSSFGLGISSDLFFKNQYTNNQPLSSFISLEIGTTLRNNSIYTGIEMQAANYYPIINEKVNLGFAGVKLGTNKNFNIAKDVTLTINKGVILNSLIEVTSSRFNDSIIYKGNPFKNLFLGGYINMQILAKYKKFHYGIISSTDIRGLAIVGSTTLPYNLKSNVFFQASLGFVIKIDL